ncbi:MAG: hypothetical protein ACNYPF_00460 [Candidatus Puniceispirillales bacterium WSBS_2018_MAG_OTU23]
MLHLLKSLKLFALAAAVLTVSSISAYAAEYTIRITNMLSDELLAPIVLVGTKADKHIFDGDYVTPEAEVQILTGDPGKLVARIGKRASVVHGSDGPPGVLLAPGKSVEVTIKTKGKKGVRIIAMVAPTMKPDHFVTAVINPSSMLPVTMDRYDIGHNEGRKTIQHVASGAAKVEIISMMDN